MVRTVVFNVLPHAMHAHDWVCDDEHAKEAPNLTVDVIHLWVALLDVHKDVVPLEVAGSWIELIGLDPALLVGSVLNRRMVYHEVEVWIIQRGLFHVLRVRQMPQRLGLIGIALVNTE